MVRVGVITYMVYQTGFQRGVVSYAKNPNQMERDMMNFVLNIDDKVDKGDDKAIKILSDHSRDYLKVERVARRILLTAKKQCILELEKAREARLHSEAQFWSAALSRLEGQWQFVVSSHDSINAFVTGVCPRKIFVYQGLLTKLEPSDDELAMILAHELSHVIMGHVDESVPTTTLLLGAELMLMSLVDPIGIWSFVFDYYLNKLRLAIEASYSRQHEDEADALGLVLLSLACFNMEKGSAVFYKLAEHEGYHNNSILSSHPSSQDRMKKLAQLCGFYTKDKAHQEYLQHSTDCGRQYRQDMIHAGVFNVGKGIYSILAAIASPFEGRKIKDAATTPVVVLKPT